MPNFRFVTRFPRWMLFYYGLVFFWLFSTAMHIPDGYLSPVTCMIMFVLVLPFWVRGVQVMRARLNAKNIPLVALFAAFSFVIMMFNIPLPGGTTGHAVGGALAAVILGPEIATIAISISLIIQALFFGDGGILAIGANCFNMAVVLPYVAYTVYSVITRNQPVGSKKRIIGAVVGAYVGLSAAAFLTSVEFGIQPAFWHSMDGTPLYAPYPLAISIPAMVIPHLLVASVVEAAVTGLAVAYLVRTNPSALAAPGSAAAETSEGGKNNWRWFWIVLVVLVIIAPIGLLAPGTAWGEWGAEELTNLGLPFIPQGMQKLSALWSAPMPDYEVPTVGNSGLAYIFSAVVGVLVTVVLVWLFSMLVTRWKDRSREKK